MKMSLPQQRQHDGKFCLQIALTLSLAVGHAVIQKQNHSSQDVRPPLFHKIPPESSQKARHTEMMQGFRVAVFFDFLHNFLYNICTR